jgi:hypothetical protein
MPANNSPLESQSSYPTAGLSQRRAPNQSAEALQARHQNAPRDSAQKNEGKQPSTAKSHNKDNAVKAIENDFKWKHIGVVGVLLWIL